MLFNQGNYELAADYLEAASLYRDELNGPDAARLDEYLQAMTQVASPEESHHPVASSAHDQATSMVQQARDAVTVGAHGAAEHLAHQAAAMGSPFGSGEDSPGQVLNDLAGQDRFAGTEDKSIARWRLLQAREDIAQGQYDKAQANIDQARMVDVNWGLFDDVTPDRVQKELDKARPAKVATNGIAPPQGSTRNQKKVAKERLSEARAMIGRGDYDGAESLAMEVQGWGLKFLRIEDSPEKVAAAARALRQTDLKRSTQSSQSTYDLLVTEARSLLNEGRYEEAAQQANHALRLNVVPPIGVDRAEAVLHEVELAQAGTPAPMPVSPLGLPEPPSSMGDPNVMVAQGNLPIEPDNVMNQVEVDDVPSFNDFPPAIPEPAGSAMVGIDPVLDAMNLAEQLPTPAEDPAQVALARSRNLLASGNYDAARTAADEAAMAGAQTEASDIQSQINLAEQSAAYQLFNAAAAALREQDIDRARALIDEVSAIDLAFAPSLKARVDDLASKLTESEAEDLEADVFETELDAMTVEAQRMNTEVSSKVSEARRLMDSKPSEGITILEETKVAVTVAEIPEPVRRTLLQRVEVALELAERDREVFEAKMTDERARADAEREHLRILEARIAEADQINALMERAVQAQDDGDYAAAETFAKRVMVIDPNNATAAAMVTLMQTKRHYEIDQRIRSAKEEGFLNALHDVDRAGVIDGEVLDRSIAYPRDFADLVRRREGIADPVPYRSVEAIEVEKALNQDVTIEMAEGTLNEAITFLQNYTGLNFAPDTRAMQDEGVTLDSPIQQLVLYNVKVKTVLELMLDQLGLSYKISDNDGVVIITTPQSRGKMIVRSYAVGDLVIPPPANPEIPNPVKPLNSGSLLDSDGYTQIGDSITTPQPSMGGTTVTKTPRQVDFGPLINLITTSIAPGSWRLEDLNTGTSTPMGGFGLGDGLGGLGGGLGGADEEQIGSITPFFLNLSLIIRTTAEIHDEVVDLLRQLRRLQDLQVSVEVRFITVSDDFFEFIGIDFDASIQSDLVGPLNAFVSQNPASVPVVPGAGGDGGGGGAAGDTPFLVNPARDHALGREPVTLGVGFPGATGSPRFSSDLQIPLLQDSFTPARGLLNLVPGSGSTFGIAFLSDLEVYLFMEALQGNTRANVVQAPKVTSFNGATATISNNTNTSIVTSLTPVVNAGAIAFQPQIAQIQDGVTLSVTPVVTADRRYVRLTLAPQFNVVEGVDVFSFGGGAVGGGGLGGGSAALTTTVQQPIITTTFVSTTVTVPDGGTVLLGGVKTLSEQRLEFGTPVLSKLPAVNRLFRNIGIGRETNSLMLMVTPRIIILEEEEEAIGIPAVPVAGAP